MAANKNQGASEVHNIDLRSDTVTRPSAAMREAMASAEVGDDVYGDDPTVNRLEAMAAERLGFDKALFVTSGTQANLVALMCHCQRGDEYIVGQQAHTYNYEAGGAAVLGSIQPQPLTQCSDGSLDLNDVAEAIKVDNIHFAKTRLLCLENTVGGLVLNLKYLQQARNLVDEHSLALHLDGARIFNAAVKLQLPVTEIAKYFDSVAFCLSKGLGAPAGSMICGTAGFIERARRWRKMLGGGMRQAGILAAAGIFALEHNVQRLAEDHSNAEKLATGLAEIEGIHVDTQRLDTNMVFTEIQGDRAPALAKVLANDGILITPGPTVRFVTHLDISAGEVDTVLGAVRDFLSKAE